MPDSPARTEARTLSIDKYTLRTLAFTISIQGGILLILITLPFRASCHLNHVQKPGSVYYTKRPRKARSRQELSYIRRSKTLLLFLVVLCSLYRVQSLSNVGRCLQEATRLSDRLWA